MSANYTASLVREDVLNIHFRLTQSQALGGRLGKILGLAKRLLKVWPELAPGEPEDVAKAIPADERRNVIVTAEEMTAVADAFMRLLASDTIMAINGAQVPNTVGIKMQILKDAKTISPDLETHLLKRLDREPVEPFAPDLDTEPAVAQE